MFARTCTLRGPGVGCKQPQAKSRSAVVFPPQLKEPANGQAIWWSINIPGSSSRVVAARRVAPARAVVSNARAPARPPLREARRAGAADRDDGRERVGAGG